MFYYLLVTTVGVVAAWYFVAYYWTATKGTWKKSAMGRHLMGLTASIGVVLTNTLIIMAWPGYPGRPWVGLVAYTASVAFLVQRCVLLNRANHGERLESQGSGRKRRVDQEV